MDAIRPSDVQAWIGAMQSEGLSPSRIRQARIVLSLALKAAVRDGLIHRNPAEDLDLPRLPHHEAAYLEPAEVERIAAATTPPFDLLIRLLGTLGPRYGEAIALRRRSVDLLRRRLVIEESLAEVGGQLTFGPTKTHAFRRVPLTPTLQRALEIHLSELGPEPDALLFTDSRGGPLRHSNFYHRVWQPALVAAGVPRVGVHVLRHSAAAALIHSGASAKAVQSILGHRSAAFTLTVYGHLFEADLDEVASRLDAAVSELLRPGRGLPVMAAPAPA